MNILVCGAGAWGTAMAIHLARIGHSVILVPRSEEKALAMRTQRENSFYLPQISFPQTLQVDCNFKAHMSTCEALFLACPMKGLESLCQTLRGNVPNPIWIISLIKGLEGKGLRRPSEIITQFFPSNPIACLSGPTYAKEFAKGLPAAMVLASEQDQDLSTFQEACKSTNVRIYRSHDLLGVELASCLKNIYALGCGILDGLKLGDNAKAAYLTRALRELTYLGTFLGGQKETFYGLSGLGDLMATAQGSWSRNRCFGERFAQGESVEKLLQEGTVEGYGSLNGFWQLAQKRKLELPILQGLYEVVYQGHSLETGIHNLMTRPLKDETA